MKKYRTSKEVTAEEMTRLEYVDSRGWALPEDEQHLKDEAVFKIFYEDGYVSMCPKDVFLKNAVEITESHIGRMEEELKLLESNCEKLQIFLETETESKRYTDETQRIHLGMQLSHMLSYKRVLELRIKYDTNK